MRLSRAIATVGAASALTLMTAVPASADGTPTDLDGVKLTGNESDFTLCSLYAEQAANSAGEGSTGYYFGFFSSCMAAGAYR